MFEGLFRSSYPLPAVFHLNPVRLFRRVVIEESHKKIFPLTMVYGRHRGQRKSSECSWVRMVNYSIRKSPSLSPVRDRVPVALSWGLGTSPKYVAFGIVER